MLGVPSCLVSASSLCRQSDQAGGHGEGGSRWTNFLFDHARARGEYSCPFQAAQVRLLVLGLLFGCDSEPVDELEELRLGCSLVPQCPFLKSIVVGHGVLPLEPFPGSCVYSIIACHCGFSLPGSMSMLRLDELSRNLDSVRVGSACFIATEVRAAANVSAIHPVLTSGPLRGFCKTQLEVPILERAISTSSSRNKNHPLISRLACCAKRETICCCNSSIWFTFQYQHQNSLKRMNTIRKSPIASNIGSSSVEPILLLLELVDVSTKCNECEIHCL